MRHMDHFAEDGLANGARPRASTTKTKTAQKLLLCIFITTLCNDYDFQNKKSIEK
jgi:hypothetical protein